MLLVLTYHRVVEDSAEVNDFFDVRASELQAHLQEVKRVWGEPELPSGLLAAQQRNGCRKGFLVTFDDGTEDHFKVAAPVLERNGVRGMFFVNTSLLGEEGFLTVEQCQTLCGRGHAIESHSHEHKWLTGMRVNELRYQLSESRRILHELGLGLCDSLAAPGGFFDEQAARIAKAEGYHFLRTLEWGYNRVLDPLFVESITVNRGTAGKWFEFMVTPRFESSKRAFYRVKETFKRGILKPLYFGLRDLRKL